MTININELRRLAQAATPGGWYVARGNYVYGCKEVTDGEEVWHPVIACTDDDEVSINFEGNAKFIAAANPAAISELLDRLEEAESDCLEQARLNGIGASREAALMAKLEAAEKERDFAKTESARLHDDTHELTDERGTYKAACNEWIAKPDKWIAKTEWAQDELTRGKLPAKYLGMHRADGIKAEIDALRAAVQHEADCVEAAKAEIEALRARIEEMEKQEPTHWSCKVLQANATWKEEVGREVPPSGYFCIRDIRPLYALPGAKGE